MEKKDDAKTVCQTSFEAKHKSQAKFANLRNHSKVKTILLNMDVSRRRKFKNESKGQKAQRLIQEKKQEIRAALLVESE